MNQLVINIAYIADNQTTVTELVNKLKTTNLHFNLVNASDFVMGEDFLKHLLVEGQPCLLMVSDNFLKSSACLLNGLNYLQTLIKNEQILPIILDGVSINENGEKIAIPTEFEKVSNVIKYMNFWQEKYLDLRKLKRGISTEEETGFLEKLKVVRSISSEVGEYLRNLRDTNYYSFEEFSANHFEVFFRIFGDEAAYLKFVEETNLKDSGNGKLETLSTPSEKEHPSLKKVPTGDFLPLEQLIIEKEKLEQPTNSTTIDNSTLEKKLEEDKINQPEIAPSESGFQQVDVNKEEIEALIAIDPEWTALNEEMDSGEKISDSGQLESAVEETPLTDTELLALELSEKLPKTKVVEEEMEGYFADEEEEEEEMISLEDLLGKDFAEVSNEFGVVERETEEQTSLNIEADEENLEKSLNSSNNMNSSEKLPISALEVSNDDLEGKEEQMESVSMEEEDAEEDELEGYFVDEGEETEELEEELSEFDVLESANTLVESGKIAAGILLLKETLVDAPEFVSVRYQYAAFLAKYQNNFKAASNELATLLEQEPNNLSAKFFLGELAEAERDYLSAKNYYEKVYEANPDFPNVAYKLGTLLVNHLKEAPVTASEYFVHAYQKDSNNVNALYQLGILQSEELDQETEAIESLKQVLEKAPEHPFANYDLAIIYHNKEERALALEYYEKAAMVNPELKTLVNDQAFAMAREEMEINVNNDYDLVQETVGVADNPSLDTTTISDDELLQEETIDGEALTPNEIISPTNELIEKPTAFEFPFPTDKEEGEANIIQETVKEDIISSKTRATKIALITGATSGIGKATAIKLAAEGYHLILTGRRFSRLFQLKDQFEKAYNSKVRLLPFDIKDSMAVQLALAELEDEWQSVDVLINNAGLAKGETAIHEGEFEHWDNMIDTNVKGLLYVTREVAPYMVKKQKGQIINVCSLAGKEVYPNNAVYCATKHAVDALTKAMRIDLHKYNIRVSQVSPGFVEDTEFSMIKHEQSEAAVLGFKPVSAQDVADVIYFMLSQPPHVNLQEIVMTGTQQATANIITKN